MQMTDALDAPLHVFARGLARGGLNAAPAAAFFDVARPRPALDSKKFLYRGIAARDFLRRFRLADGIEVIAAALENGLRRINLFHPAAEPSVKVVEIMTGGQ